MPAMEEEPNIPSAPLFSPVTSSSQTLPQAKPSAAAAKRPAADDFEDEDNDDDDEDDDDLGGGAVSRTPPLPCLAVS